MAQFVLASPDTVPPNSMRAFDVSGRRVLVVNLNGQFYALDDLCPHLAVPLSRGDLRDDCITCAGHGSVFNVANGEATKWIGKQITWLTRLLEGRPKNATTYPLTVTGGQLVVDLP